MKYKRWAAAMVAGGLPFITSILLQYIHGDDNREMLRPVGVAAIYPVLTVLYRFTDPSVYVWYTPRARRQIGLLSALFALSGVFLRVGVGLTGNALVAGDLIGMLVYMALVAYVQHRAFRQSQANRG